MVLCVVVMVFAGLFAWARVHKIEGDRSQTILNIRNSQQAMRGEQGMKQLMAGDPFTRRDLETFMKFPSDIHSLHGTIEFEPGDKVTPESAGPATNNDHLWLKVKAPDTHGHVGKYGFSDIGDTTGW